MTIFLYSALLVMAPERLEWGNWRGTHQPLSGRFDTALKADGGERRFRDFVNSRRSNDGLESILRSANFVTVRGLGKCLLWKRDLYYGVNAFSGGKSTLVKICPGSKAQTLFHMIPPY